MRSILLCFCVVFFSGCASSGFVPTGKDTYMISKTSFACGIGSASNVKAGLLKKANKFCSNQGKTLQQIDERLVGGFIGRCASAEIQFRCAE